LGSTQKSHIAEFYINVFDERNGLVRFPIDKHWDIISYKIVDNNIKNNEADILLSKLFYHITKPSKKWPQVTVGKKDDIETKIIYKQLKKNNMKLSDFLVKLIWFIGLMIIFTTSWILDTSDKCCVLENIYILLLRIFSTLSLFMWSVGLSETFKDILSLKYKIIEEDYYVYAYYLTSWWLFIPIWKAIEIKYNSYETQNIFGATSDSYYNSDIYYKNKEEALIAIEKHKKKILRNKKKWFSMKIKEYKTTTYI